MTRSHGQGMPRDVHSLSLIPEPLQSPSHPLLCPSAPQGHLRTKVEGPSLGAGWGLRAAPGSLPEAGDFCHPENNELLSDIIGMNKHLIVRPWDSVMINFKSCDSVLKSEPESCRGAPRGLGAAQKLGAPSCQPRAWGDQLARLGGVWAAVG